MISGVIEYVFQWHITLREEKSCFVYYIYIFLPWKTNKFAIVHYQMITNSQKDEGQNMHACFQMNLRISLITCLYLYMLVLCFLLA